MPNLAKLAFKFAFLISSSASVERSFSKLDKVQKGDRKSLNSETLKFLLFLYFTSDKLPLLIDLIQNCEILNFYREIRQKLQRIATCNSKQYTAKFRRAWPQRANQRAQTVRGRCEFAQAKFVVVTLCSAAITQ